MNDQSQGSVLIGTRFTVTGSIVEADRKITSDFRAQELCESRGGCPELPLPNSPCGRYGRKATLNLNLNLRTELRSCVKFEMAVLGSPPLIVLTVSMGVKQR